MAEHRQIANNDLSAYEDFLGMEPRFSALTEFIRSCSTPMTVAIQGDWGTGKTTAMNNIRKMLIGKPEYDLTLPQYSNIVDSERERLKRLNLKNEELTVWFNTWQFSVLSDNDCLIIDLLYMLAETLIKRLDAVRACFPQMRRQTDSAEKTVRSLLRGLLGLAISGGKFLISQSDTVSGIKDMLDGMKLTDGHAQAEQTDPMTLLQSMHSNTATVMMLKETVNQAVQELLALTGKDRIYFFIDDLDRLSPHVAVELLECMKNFLDCEGCVFVLAIDQDVIERGLRRKYGEDFDVTNSRRAAQFFDKIIQVPFELPVDSYKLEAYVQKLLTDSCLLENTAENAGAETESFLSIIKTFGEYNPRTIKRSFNLLALYSLMSRDAQSEIADRYAFVLLVIRARNEYKALSRILSHLPESGNLYENLMNALSGSKTLLSSPDIRALLAAFGIRPDDETAENQTEHIRRLLLSYRETTEAIADKNEPFEEDSADAIADRLEATLRSQAADGVTVAAEWAEGSRNDQTLNVTRANTPLLRIRTVDGNVHVTIYKYNGTQTADLLRGVENLFYVIGSGEERQFGYYDHTGHIVLAYLSSYFSGCAVDTVLRNAGILR